MIIGALALAALGAAAKVPPAIGDLRAVPALTRAEAAEQRPFHGVGVVTFVPYWRERACIVAATNDPNGTAVYVSGAIAERPVAKLLGFDKLEAGQVVEITGTTWAAAFAPGLRAAEILLLGRQALTPAPEVRLKDLAWGSHDNQRVRLRGVVTAVPGHTEADDRMTTLRLATADGPFIAHIHGTSRDLGTLVDAEVRLEGVAMSFFNQRSEFIGVQVEVADESGLTVLKPAPSDPFAAPPVPLDAILAYSPAPPDCHRRMITGLVTYTRPGEFFYLQDGGHAVRVNTSCHAPVAIGDIVEAAGFPTLAASFSELENAVYRRTGRHGEPPPPLALAPKDLLSMHLFPEGNLANYDCRLIRTEGRLFRADANSPAKGETELYLDVGTRTLRARLAGPLPPTLAREIGNEPVVSLTGICRIKLESGLPAGRVPAVTDVLILLRDGADITILPDLAWQARRRGRFLGRAAYGALALAVFVIVGLLWRINHNRRIRQRMQAVIDERKRMAGDLHDSIEQHISGARMLLQASLDLTPETPARVKEAIGMATGILAAAKAEVKTIVWNLRSDALHARTLADLLGDLATKLSAARRVRIHTRLEALPTDLPPTTVVELLSIAQEATTNAIDHGHATKLLFGARRTAAGFALEIVNNGAPFDPDAALGPAQGHFGLAQLRERANRIGATLIITSRPALTIVKIEVKKHDYRRHRR